MVTKFLYWASFVATRKKFLSSRKKKMSRFKKVYPQEIQKIFENATPPNTKKAKKFGLKFFVGVYLSYNFFNCQLSPNRLVGYIYTRRFLAV